jgi:hypothetical protein
MPNPLHLTSRQNLFQDCMQIVIDFRIRKPDHPVTSFLQPASPGLIVFALASVPAAIQLDHQASFGAVEIGHERPYWMLAAEFIAIQAAIP